MFTYCTWGAIKSYSEAVRKDTVKLWIVEDTTFNKVGWKSESHKAD